MISTFDITKLNALLKDFITLRRFVSQYLTRIFMNSLHILKILLLFAR